MALWSLRLLMPLPSTRYPQAFNIEAVKQVVDRGHIAFTPCNPVQPQKLQVYSSSLFNGFRYENDKTHSTRTDVESGFSDQQKNGQSPENR